MGYKGKDHKSHLDIHNETMETLINTCNKNCSVCNKVTCPIRALMGDSDLDENKKQALKANLILLLWIGHGIYLSSNDPIALETIYDISSEIITSRCSTAIQAQALLSVITGYIVDKLPESFTDFCERVDKFYDTKEEQNASKD